MSSLRKHRFAAFWLRRLCDPHSKHVPILIDRSPEAMFLALKREYHLIHMPCVATTRATTAQFNHVRLAAYEAPLPQRTSCRTLLDLAADLNIACNSDALDEPMHVTHAEYTAACEQLRSAGVPLKLGCKASWRAFIHLRSQYDVALLARATLIYAPRAPWSSDRKKGPVKRKHTT